MKNIPVYEGPADTFSLTDNGTRPTPLHLLEPRIAFELALRIPEEELQRKGFFFRQLRQDGSCVMLYGEDFTPICGRMVDIVCNTVRYLPARELLAELNRQTPSPEEEEECLDMADIMPPELVLPLSARLRQQERFRQAIPLLKELAGECLGSRYTVEPPSYPPDPGFLSIVCAHFFFGQRAGELLHQLMELCDAVEIRSDPGSPLNPPPVELLLTVYDCFVEGGESLQEEGQITKDNREERRKGKK